MSPETAAYPTDEQILEIDDSPEVSSESAETPESVAPIETQADEVSEETQLRPEQAKPETLTQPKQADKQQPTKEQQPATTPEAQTIEAKAAELDRADQAFLTDDAEGKYQTFQSLFGDNPAALEGAMWSARQFAQVNAPQTLAMHDRMVVSESLTAQGAWEGLQIIHDSALKSGDKQTAALVEQYAAGFQQEYGIGPKTPEVREAEWKDYQKYIGAQLLQDVDSAIRRAFGEKLSSVQPMMQEELVKDARIAVTDLLRKDTKLDAAFQKLYEGYSHREGAGYYYNTFSPRMRALVSRVVQNSVSQHADIFKNYTIQTSPQTRPQPAQPTKPKSMAQHRAEGRTLGEITREELGELDETNPLEAGSEEVNRMSKEEILGSNRAGRPRPKTRPENIFDEARP